MKQENPLHTYSVPGAILREWILPAREPCAMALERGHVLRLVDIEGQQVSDLVCFNERDLTEQLSTGNSVLLNKRFRLRQGDVLYSTICTPMLRIVGSSNEFNLACGSMCSEELNRLRYGVSGTRNCRDNFAMVLRPWGIDRRHIPNAFHLFMRTDVDPGGGLDIKEPTSRPGDYCDLRAEMELLVAISNCPQELNACNAFHPTPMGIIIYEPARTNG